MFFERLRTMTAESEYWSYKIHFNNLLQKITKAADSFPPSNDP